MYKSNYFNLPISEHRSEGVKFAGHPTVQGAKRREGETTGQYVCWEAAEGPYLEIYGASFVKAKTNYEISGF